MKLCEMTDAQLNERLEMLQTIDTCESDALKLTIEKELAARAAAREEKKTEAAKKDMEKELRSKQHEVLGKYYQIDGNVYKVTGVVADRVFLESVVTYKVGGYQNTSAFYTVRPINEVLAGKEVTEKEYQTRTLDVDSAVTKASEAVKDLFKRDSFFETLDKRFKKYDSIFNGFPWF